jgi:hypothetical protein
MDAIERHGQVLIEEIHGVIVVCENPTDATSRHDDHIRPDSREVPLRLILPGKVEFVSARQEQRARLSLETAHDGGADHAVVASYEYAFLGQIERGG